MKFNLLYLNMKFKFYSIIIFLSNKKYNFRLEKTQILNILNIY